MEPLSQERLRIRITKHDGINWYKNEDIGKEFDVVEVRENTYLIDTDEPFELGVTKSHCELVSGTVPQERLSKGKSAVKDIYDYWEDHDGPAIYSGQTIASIIYDVVNHLQIKIEGVNDHE